MATSNARQSIPEDPEPQGTRRAGPVLRFSRTAEQVESNRVFMAAAGRVEFGRYENTLRTVWIAFALFASLGPERICYAAVERKRKDDGEEKPGIAERAKVSGRTVRRHIPALIERGLIYAENRVGGRTPTVWKVILPDELIAPVLTAVSAQAGHSVRRSKRSYVRTGPQPFQGKRASL